MARFKYKGEQIVGNFSGNTTKIKLKKSDGTVEVLQPVSPAPYFPVNADVGHDITDELSLRQLRADNRFEEIV